jgi:hypothetical protein
VSAFARSSLLVPSASCQSEGSPVPFWRVRRTAIKNTVKGACAALKQVFLGSLSRTSVLGVQMSSPRRARRTSAFERLLATVLYGRETRAAEAEVRSFVKRPFNGVTGRRAAALR